MHEPWWEPCEGTVGETLFLGFSVGVFVRVVGVRVVDVKNRVVGGG